MAFATWTPAFTDNVSTIPAAALNQWRVDIGRAMDGTGGSAGTPYAPATQILIAGSGLKIQGSAPFDTAVGTVSTFSGTQAFAGSSVFSASATFDGTAQFNSTTRLWGTTSVDGAFSVLTTRTMTFNGGSTLTLAGTAGGGTFTAAAGSTVNLNGDVNIAAPTVDFVGSAIGLDTTSVMTLDSATLIALTGSYLQINSGATYAWSGTGTRTASLTLSGAGATTIWRTAATTDADGPYTDGNDFYFIPAGLTVDRTYTVSDATTAGQTITFRRANGSGGFDAILRRSDASLIVRMSNDGAANPSYVQLVWFGGRWEVVAWGGGDLTFA